jgi:hypothetical protein
MFIVVHFYTLDNIMIQIKNIHLTETRFSAKVYATDCGKQRQYDSETGSQQVSSIVRAVACMMMAICGAKYCINIPFF